MTSATSGLKLLPAFFDAAQQLALVAGLRDLARGAPFFTPVMRTAVRSGAGPSAILAAVLMPGP